MSPPEQIETIGGRYRLGDRLGAGGMGEVFVAHDLRLDREVALKLLRADLAQQAGMRERVVAEARLAARLTHPHVVGVLDTGEQDGRPFVVMERLSVRTLRDELADGPMPPSGSATSGCRSCGRSPRLTSSGSSTATSSPATSWTPASAPGRWRTSGSRSGSTRRRR